MEQTTTPQTLKEVIRLLTQQQTEFQAMMQRQHAVSEARIDALAARPKAVRKTQPPTYYGKLEEDLELWFFTLEQYYADDHPIMTEESPQFVIMTSCHLGVTPMNWFRKFMEEFDATSQVKT